MINMIWAQGANGELGLNGQLPWRLPADLKRFKELTEHHVVIMGRKTFQSIGKPLPNRVNIVLTRDAELELPDDVFVYNSFTKLVNDIRKSNVYVIGGAELYHKFMPFADRLFVTRIKGTFDADTYAPVVPNDFKLTWDEEYELNSDKMLDYKFEVYTKID